MNLYVSLTELKAFMSISGSSQDTKLTMLNKIATNAVNDYLGVSDLALHKVTEEVHHANARRYRLRDLHVSAIGTILDDETAYTQDDAYDIEASNAGLNYILNLSEYLTSGERKAKITYVAGWNASGMIKITVDITGMDTSASLTFGAVSSDGFTITRGVDWTAQATDEDEASAIATALDAKSGVRAFSMGSVVYVVEDTNPQVITRTVTTDDADNLVLSDSILRSVDMPESIRMAVMVHVASLFHMSKNPRLKSYSIGEKTVQFAAKSDADSYESYLRSYLRGRVMVL